MFGIGNKDRRRVRNDTFGGNNIRNAAIAGIGMLAWKWWRNRQSNDQWSSGVNRSSSGTSESFSESSPAGGRY